MDLVDVERVRVAHDRGDLTLAPGEIVLGGGTWLFSEPQPGTHGLVDLTGMGWDPVVALADGGLSIAATCTFDRLRAAGHPLFGPACDALLGSWKIHRFATVGGNICLALPAGPMTSLAAGLGGVAVIWTAQGERRMPVAAFVTGVRRTALAPGEVLRAIELPGTALRERSAMRRASLAELGRSAALVIGRRDGDGFVLTVTAATPRPYVLTYDVVPTAERLTADVDAIGDWYDDVHGAPDWRHAMTGRFALELLEELG